MHVVYVLKSLSADKSYVGMTNDLSRRLGEHNNGHNFYTKRHVPWVVVHQEQCDTLGSARQREKYLKSAAGRHFLKAEVFGKE